MGVDLGGGGICLYTKQFADDQVIIANDKVVVVYTVKEYNKNTDDGV